MSGIEYDPIVWDPENEGEGDFEDEHALPESDEPRPWDDETPALPEEGFGGDVDEDLPAESDSRDDFREGDNPGESLPEFEQDPGIEDDEEQILLDEDWQDDEVDGPDELFESTEGVPEPPLASRPDDAEDWSEIDPTYEPDEPEESIVTSGEQDLADDTEDDEPDEPLDPENPPEPEPGDHPTWKSYELWGRNLDEVPSEWRLLATQDYGSEEDSAVAGLPTGTQWEFRARLISDAGAYSEFSVPIVYHLPSDFTPPPIPTAPVISESNGFISYGWDGLLLDAFPIDFMRVNMYARAQGGDPILLSQFRTEGYQSTGRLQAGVEHEFWLTSVDTTYNESARSESVKATPTQPVDAEAIRARVNELRDRADNLMGEIEAQGIFANEAVLGEIWAGIGNFIEINVDDLDVNKLAASEAFIAALETQVFTGMTIQTHKAANRGVKLLQTGLAAYNAAGQQTFGIVANTGEVGASGTFTAQSGNSVAGLTPGMPGTNRPGLLLSTNGGVSQSGIQLVSADDDQGAPGGRLIIAGTERANNTGRGELRIEQGGAFALGRMTGNFSGIGVSIGSTNNTTARQLQLRGRQTLNTHWQAMQAFADTDSYAIPSGTDSSFLLNVSYGPPVDDGTRRTVATARVTRAAADAGNGVSLAVVDNSSTGFTAVCNKVPARSAVATFGINAIGTWL